MAGELASLASLVAPPDGGKLARSFALRRGAVRRLVAWARDHRDRARPLLWVHAPSVGEGLMAAPVIERTRQTMPHVQLIYTFFSPSAEAFASRLAVDFSGPLPFDTGRSASAVLDALQPSALVFSKLDVWPLLVAAAAQRAIPVALISATLSESSSRRSAFAKLLLHDAYATLSAVGATSDADAARLVELGVRPDRILVTGDTRYDQVWARVQSSAANQELVDRLASSRPTLVAGSTWPSDDVHLLVAFSILRMKVPGARLVLAAHEPGPEQQGKLRMFANQAHLSVASLEQATPATDIVWVDRMGVLADLYRLASVAYVGGGFHDQGLHSVIEPAAHGAPVVFGPAHADSRDALALLAGGGAFSATNGHALAERLVELCSDQVSRARVGERAKRTVIAGLGAAERTVALVQGILRR